MTDFDAMLNSDPQSQENLKLQVIDNIVEEFGLTRDRATFIAGIVAEKGDKVMAMVREIDDLFTDEQPHESMLAVWLFIGGVCNFGEDLKRKLRTPMSLLRLMAKFGGPING